jgi:chromosome partitioning protein
MLIAPDRGNLHKIVILNPKGGCGKTTLATNIAAYYAMRGPAPTLADLDPQGYSMRWLEKRHSDRPSIHGGGAHQSMMQGREALQLQLSAETETLIIDLPAALNSAAFYRRTSAACADLPTETETGRCRKSYTAKHDEL